MSALVLNADLGEGEPFERTRELMAVIGAANVACGGHAGSAETMRVAVELAREFGVLIGAHPGVAGEFGRGAVDVDGDALEELVVEQVGRLVAVVGSELHHVKLHGGLYHAVERRVDLAERYCAVMRERFPGVRIFSLAGGVVERVAGEMGVEAWGEVFAERGYGADGRLVPRGMEGDLIEDVDAIVRRVAEWQRTGWLGARTVCVHADSPGAVEIARAVAGITPGGQGRSRSRRR